MKKFGRIILAGGLNPDNVEEAIKWVQPYGIDVTTGIEGDNKGKKDHKKLRIFIEKARSASKNYRKIDFLDINLSFKISFNAENSTRKL